MPHPVLGTTMQNLVAMVTGIQNWCTPRPDSSSTALANMTTNHFLFTIHLLCLIIDICFEYHLFWLVLVSRTIFLSFTLYVMISVIWPHTNLNKTVWTLSTQSLPVVVLIYIFVYMNRFSDQLWTLPVSNGLKRMGFPPFFTLQQYQCLNYTTSYSEKAVF